MQSPRTITPLLLLILALTGCGKDIGPTSDQILSALNLELAAGLNATAASKETEENLGTEALPEVQARVSVTIELTEDFYENQGSIGGYGIPHKTLIQKVADKGTVLNGTVVTKSVRIGNSWDIDFQRYDVARVPGEPQSRFTLNSYVVNGSTEHEQLNAELDAARLVAEDEERQRQEQLALEQEAERQRQAEAEAEALDEVIAFRRSVSGEWESEFPVEWRGQTFSNFAGTISYRIRFPVGDDLRGAAEITISTNPSEGQERLQSTLTGVYEFRAGRKDQFGNNEFIINEERSNASVGNWSIGNGWRMTLEGNNFINAEGNEIKQRLRRVSQ